MIIIVINNQLLIGIGSSVDMVIAFVATTSTNTEIVNINLLVVVLVICFNV